MADNDAVKARMIDMMKKIEKKLEVEKKSALTPEWIVENENIFSSEVEGFEETASQCHAVESGANRFVMHDSSGQLRGENVELDHCYICMDLGEHVPLLQDYMFNGKVLEDIIVRRITSIQGKNREIEVMKFDKCRVSMCEKFNSLFGFCFSYKAITTTCIVWDPETGNRVGQVGTLYDAGAMKTEPTSDVPYIKTK